MTCVNVVSAIVPSATGELLFEVDGTKTAFGSTSTVNVWVSVTPFAEAVTVMLAMPCDLAVTFSILPHISSSTVATVSCSDLAE